MAFCGDELDDSVWILFLGSTYMFLYSCILVCEFLCVFSLQALGRFEFLGCKCALGGFEFLHRMIQNAQEIASTRLAQTSRVDPLDTTRLT